MFEYHHRGMHKLKEDWIILNKQFLLVGILALLCPNNADATVPQVLRYANILGSSQMPRWPMGWPLMVNENPISCSNEGVYRHPTDCTMFYNCITVMGSKDYFHLSFKCLEGSIFSAEQRECVPGSASTCIQDVVWQTATTADDSYVQKFSDYRTFDSPSSIIGLNGPKCDKEGRMANPNDCGNFYECIKTNESQFVAIERSCDGNAFDTTTSTCVPSQMVKGCSPNSSRSPKMSTVEDPVLQTHCKNITSNFTCSDCKNAVMCVGEKAYRLPCMDGTSCIMDKISFNGGVCHYDAPAECKCNTTDIFRRDFYNSSKYLFCGINDVVVDPIVHTCPEGSLFNEDRRDCQTQIDPACSEPGIFAIEGDCSRYYTCKFTIKGWAQEIFTCNDTKMYNEDSGHCENPCNWHSGEFTCNEEGRFAKPLDCSSFYECIIDPLDSNKFIQLEFACPNGLQWNQKGNNGQCVMNETMEKCVSQILKPKKCSIPSDICSAPITTCKSLSCEEKSCFDKRIEYKFCQCEDMNGTTDGKCVPCPEGHISNATGCYPGCSLLTCGTNEVCSDGNGQLPGICECSKGYILSDGQCKAQCSKLTCGPNEVCSDGDGQLPGDCLCVAGYVRTDGKCKATCTITKCGLNSCIEKGIEYDFCQCEDNNGAAEGKCVPCPEGHISNTTGCYPGCSSLTCGTNELCNDYLGQLPGICDCIEGYVRTEGLCNADCTVLTCGTNEVCINGNGLQLGGCECAPGYIRTDGECKADCTVLTCETNEVCNDNNGQQPGVCDCVAGYIHIEDQCKADCTLLTCGTNEVCINGSRLQVGGCECAPGYVHTNGECKADCTVLRCNTNEVCNDNNGQRPGVCDCKTYYSRVGGQCNRVWPRGNYGLPKADSGCPGSSNWREGTRYHDLENDGNTATEVPSGNHFAGSFGSNIRQKFCMKSDTGGPDWPSGNYCVYKYWNSCPSGFSGNGYIKIDDEDSNNKNDQSGALPSGTYDKNTKYEFCCRNDGRSYTSIDLPTSKPFYLFPRGQQCQKVRGMSSTLEFMKYDAEDDDPSNEIVGNTPGTSPKGDRNPKIYHCYYQ